MFPLLCPGPKGLGTTNPLAPALPGLGLCCCWGSRILVCYGLLRSMTPTIEMRLWLTWNPNHCRTSRPTAGALTEGTCRWLSEALALMDAACVVTTHRLLLLPRPYRAWGLMLFTRSTKVLRRLKQSLVL